MEVVVILVVVVFWLILTTRRKSKNDLRERMYDVQELQDAVDRARHEIWGDDG